MALKYQRIEQKERNQIVKNDNLLVKHRQSLDKWWKKLYTNCVYKAITVSILRFDISVRYEKRVGSAHEHCKKEKMQCAR